jgi:hypothetical protein
MFGQMKKRCAFVHKKNLYKLSKAVKQVALKVKFGQKIKNLALTQELMQSPSRR